MKSLQALSKRVDQWWRMYIANAPEQRQPGYKASSPSEPNSRTDGTHPTQKIRGKKTAQKIPPTAFFVIAVASVTSSFGYRFYSTPQLRPGTLAPETISAPRTEKVVDEKETENRRKQIRTGSYTVLKINLELNEELKQTLDSLLAPGTSLRRKTGAFPYVDESRLPPETQRYLRQLSDSQWQQITEVLETFPLDETTEQEPQEGSESDDDAVPDPQYPLVLNPQLQGAIAQLQSLKEESSASEWATVLFTISEARNNYEFALHELQTQQQGNSNPLYTPALFDWSEATWEETTRGIERSLDRILTQGLAEGLPERQLRQAIALQVQDWVPPETQKFASDTLHTVLKGQHNLIHDKDAANRLAEKAAEAFPDIEYQVHKGEIIVHKGEKISEKQFVLIDHFELSQRQINWEGLTAYALLISGSVTLFWWVERRVHSGIRQRDRILILLLTLTSPLLVSLKLPSIALSGIGLLLGGFYGSTVATTVVSLIATVLPIGMDVIWNQWLASAAGGILAGIMAGRMRSREEAALLGMGVGMTQSVTYLAVTLIQTAIPGIAWQPLLTRAAFQGLGGLASSIAALGLSPYLEHLFDLVTPVRLAEISNPNRPLLQRLASEAPGTFQHTLFVSTLAEAATRTLGGNCELVRAGTLYHDIGKMHDPLGFIENQMGGPNKHDEIEDPWKSAEIIKKHVSEGLVLAKQYRLPKAVRAFIPEHQGSMLIAFFYYQAKQMAEADPNVRVNEADFRYPGPIPQSRETGIVMLADSCEAALRSLKEATYEEALAMVNKILRARWQDNQLVDSGLKREEMPVIADTFVRVWQQFNHKRIAYPKGALPK
ncbi:HD family phosphohydrolase [Roseofilum capinflatum]|uniref:HDIG domain-containing protein n=1 Tax=Roseofilum capinflatum BLCC-M114 TaxID=3022440 RepID=A0ABT7B780_9CYAN|nr:HDIG domain-containing metalloprotein [Roseofilum capinflatum]MDJ1175015.1 HDIG domain-containing protein [Roseofilum capinflatum BLCC-M114]